MTSNLFITYLFNLFIIYSNGVDIDPLGYILYCPCMGRFGNQADHFLGALDFAYGLNRTLALPPWVEYRYGEPKSIQVPFTNYFKVEPLKRFHKVITMEQFMEEIAPVEWPPNKRVSFCYMSRSDSENSCNAKGGNPFGPFWDTFNVDFVDSEFYSPLHYDTHHHNMAQQWKERYPPSKWPVLAFTGAPATFPVQKENRKLHKYVEWSDNIQEKVANFSKNTLPNGAFVAIHLRNGVDWLRACEHIPDSPNLFAAPQCLGFRNEKGNATKEMCLPSQQTIIKQLKRTIKKLNQNSTNLIKFVYVSSDNNYMIDELREALQRMNVEVFKYPENNPHVDLAIMGQANYFIGNCISSFSAFVKRERDVKGFPSSFWAFPPEKIGAKNKATPHDEL